MADLDDALSKINAYATDARSAYIPAEHMQQLGEGVARLRAANARLRELLRRALPSVEFIDHRTARKLAGEIRRELED